MRDWDRTKERLENNPIGAVEKQTFLKRMVLWPCKQSPSMIDRYKSLTTSLTNIENNEIYWKNPLRTIYPKCPFPSRTIFSFILPFCPSLQRCQVSKNQTLHLWLHRLRKKVKWTICVFPYVKSYPDYKHVSSKLQT